MNNAYYNGENMDEIDIGYENGKNGIYMLYISTNHRGVFQNKNMIFYYREVPYNE